MMIIIGDQEMKSKVLHIYSHWMSEHPRRYQQTLMYGRYSESLGDYAREEAERQRVSEKGIESIH